MDTNDNVIPQAVRRLVAANSDVYVQLQTSNKLPTLDPLKYTVGASVDIPPACMAALALVDSTINTQLAVNVYRAMYSQRFTVVVRDDERLYYVNNDWLWSTEFELTLMHVQIDAMAHAPLVSSLVAPLATRLADIVTRFCHVIQGADLCAVSAWLASMNRGEDGT